MDAASRFIDTGNRATAPRRDDDLYKVGCCTPKRLASSREPGLWLVCRLHSGGMHCLFGIKSDLNISSPLLTNRNWSFLVDAQAAATSSESVKQASGGRRGQCMSKRVLMCLL